MLTKNKLVKNQLDSRKGHIRAYTELLDIFNDEENVHLATTSVDLSKYGYTKDESLRFDKDLTGANIKQIIDHINWRYNYAWNCKNVSGQHLDFDAFDQGKAFVFFLHKTLLELGDTDLMNASHAALPDEVFSISQGCIDLPGISTTTSHTTPRQRTTSRKEMDKNKQKVTTSIVERNEEMKEFAMVQKEKEEVQKKAKHDYSESLYNTFEELENKIFETKMQVRTIEQDILKTIDINELSNFNARKEHLSNKLI